MVHNGRVARVEDAKRDNRFYPDVDRVTGCETRSVLCVPLKLRSETIGVLELINKKDGGFTSEDEDLIWYFAANAALAIEKTMFYEEKKNYEIHFTNIVIEAIENLLGKRGRTKSIAKYSLLMAKGLDLSQEHKKILYKASLLHDIGFLRLGMKEISSPEAYRRHPQIGYEMLKPISLFEDVARIVLHHHERYDGKGYPNGLKGEEIPLFSRIIGIADAFYATLSRQSNTKAGFQEAVEELKNNAGTRFDPKLVKNLIGNISEGDLI